MSGVKDLIHNQMTNYEKIKAIRKILDEYNEGALDADEAVQNISYVVDDDKDDRN